MKDERKTSRSQRSMLILLTKNSVLQIEQGDLLTQRKFKHVHLKTGKSLNVEQAHDRTGRPVTDTAAVQDDARVYHEANTLNVDEEVLRERMEKSIVVNDENHEPMMVNEADMDFKIAGLPHSVVQHGAMYQRSRINSEIENHPNRHALQQDLRQNQSFNPFSPESKQMIRDVENIELCELLETEPKT